MRNPLQYFFHPIVQTEQLKSILKIISSYFSQILIWKMIYKLMKQTQLQVYISVTKRKWDNYVHSLVCNFSYNLGFVLVWSTLLLYYKYTLYKCAYIQIHNVQYKLGLAFFSFLTCSDCDLQFLEFLFHRKKSWNS
jgi:hypothetical protein